ARALMMQPKLLILDEPTLGLAPVILEQLSEALEKVRAVRLDHRAARRAVHHKACAEAQDFPLSAARSCDRAVEPGLMRDITYGPISDAERAAMLNETKIEFKRNRVLEVE